MLPALGLTLFQRDPKPRGMNGGGQGGGHQTGEPVGSPVREVFAVYPNPTNSQAQIDYSLRAEGKASLAVYDVLGRLVRVLEEGVKPAGVHRVSWDGKNQDSGLAPSGVYFLRLGTPERVKTKRLVVVR